MKIPLFGKKKEPEAVKEMPVPPRFPEMEEVKNAIKPAVSQPSIFLPPLPQSPSLPPLTPIIRERPVERPSMMQYTSGYPIMPMPQEMPREMPERIQEISMPSPRRVIVSEEEAYGYGSRKKSKEPIYVKIEHFKVALASFEEIKKRLQDSFDLLDKIKETRAGEQEKINNWEKEMEEIKTRISELENKLFSRIEE